MDDIGLSLDELRELGSLASQVQEKEDNPDIRDEIGEPEITVKSAPVLRSGSGSADNVVFLGYIDEPEELLSGGKRRCLFGVSSIDDVAYLPTDDGLTLPNGGKTAKPADWSIALVPGGNSQVLTGGSWGAL